MFFIVYFFIILIMERINKGKELRLKWSLSLVLFERFNSDIHY